MQFAFFLSVAVRTVAHTPSMVRTWIERKRATPRVAEQHHDPVAVQQHSPLLSLLTSRY